MMNVNPMQLIGLLKGGMNPEQLVRSIIKENNINDPTINEMVSLAQNGDISSLNKMAENYFGQQGLNFGQEFNSFMSMFK